MNVTAQQGEAEKEGEHGNRIGTAWHGGRAPAHGRPGGDLVSAHRRDRVLVVDCGRGSPSAFAGAGLHFSRLEAVFLTHLHAHHTGDPACSFTGGDIRAGKHGPLPPIRVYGPPRPETVPEGDATFHRQTTIHPELPAPSMADLVEHTLAGYAYHLNVMPRTRMPDAGALVRATDSHPATN